MHAILVIVLMVIAVVICGLFIDTDANLNVHAAIAAPIAAERKQIISEKESGVKTQRASMTPSLTTVRQRLRGATVTEVKEARHDLST
jgi:hypothetical protein